MLDSLTCPEFPFGFRGVFTLKKEEYGELMDIYKTIIGPRICVLLSTYNGEKYIKQQLDSIISQTVNNVDIIVRDDGSSDLTLQILEEYASRGLIQLYKGETNLGPAHSFLTLLSISDGYDFYFFSDQDDVWMPDKISRAMDQIEKIDDIPVLYYSNAELVDDRLRQLNKNVYGRKQFPHMVTVLCGCSILGCTISMNRKLRDIVKSKYSNQLKIGMHDYFVSEICMICGGKIKYDDIPSLLYRQHDNNVIGYKIKKTVSGRIEELFSKKQISIEEDAKTLLLYEDVMTDEGKKYVYIISQYKSQIRYRIKLAKEIFELVIKQEAGKHEVLKAMKILLGNA